jgi:hypothetical protein
VIGDGDAIDGGGMAVLRSSAVVAICTGRVGGGGGGGLSMTAMKKIGRKRRGAGARQCLQGQEENGGEAPALR